MRLILCHLLILCLLSVSCNQTELIQDKNPSPASLNQKRIIFERNGEISLGVLKADSLADSVRFRVYGIGTWSIDAPNPCGYHYGQGYNNQQWQTIDMLGLPTEELCKYDLTINNKDFDAPGIGNILVRRFTDTNFLPATIEVNGKIEKGSAVFQIRQDLTNNFGGVHESERLKIYHRMDSGTIFIHGCCNDQSDIFDFKNNDPYIETDLSYLYRYCNGINKDCIFDVRINYQSLPIKDAFSLYISVYKQSGSWLEAPAYSEENNQACFEFMDGFSSGISVNGINASKINQHKLCVEKKDHYTVEGITSRFRTFWGIFKDGQWEIK